MPNLTITVILALFTLLSLVRTDHTDKAASPEFHAKAGPATPQQTGATNAPHQTPLFWRSKMNKKQLAVLVATIVLATQRHADTVMETTEDEARTLVGMKLRTLANELVQKASGATEEEAKAAIAAATAEIKAAATAKADAKKAEAAS